MNYQLIFHSIRKPLITTIATIETHSHSMSNSASCTPQFNSVSNFSNLTPSDEVAS